MKSYINYLGIILVVVASLSFDSCKKLPNFSVIPSIQVESNWYNITRNFEDSSMGSFCDSVTIKLKFEDGDGDLGLSADDIKNNTTPNFYMKTYITNGAFNYQGTLYNYKDTILYTGQFPPLTYLPENIKGPVSGELRYSVKFDYVNYYMTVYDNIKGKDTTVQVTNDSLKFDIYVMDRASHVSNTVTTPILVIHTQ
ncbi:MAG TPA: hypothetical protein VK766_00340 [Cytophagaceae bacterium]|nr:hypothetical protein [Cytophagaceae bacterium]